MIDRERVKAATNGVMEISDMVDSIYESSPKQAGGFLAAYYLRDLYGDFKPSKKAIDTYAFVVYNLEGAGIDSIERFLAEDRLWEPILFDRIQACAENFGWTDGGFMVGAVQYLSLMIIERNLRRQNKVEQN